MDIASGLTDECALGKEGEVRCWGASHPSTYQRPLDPAAAERIPELPPAIRIASGRAHTCALLADGRIRCWAEIHGYRPAPPQPAPVPGIADAVDLAAGLDFTCARLRDGRVRCWGQTDNLPPDISLGQ